MNIKRLGLGLSALTLTTVPTLASVANVSAITFGDVKWTGAPGLYEDGTLTLTRDSGGEAPAGLDLEVVDGETAVLDLASFRLVNYSTGCATIWVKKGGTLTIRDSGEGTGEVTQIADSTAATIYNEGKLIIEAGAFSQAASAERPVIDNHGGEVVITGGTFIGMNTTVGKYTPVINNEGGKVTISDAVVTQNGPYYAVQTISGGETTISSGTYKSTVESGAAAVIGNLPGEAESKSTITVTGGTFSMPTTTQLVVADYAGNTTTIAGGIFSGAIYSGNDRTVITGGTFSGAFSSHETEAGKVAGGTFGVKPTAHLAEGYTTLKNADGTYTVKKAATTETEDRANNTEDTETTSENEAALAKVSDEIVAALEEAYGTLENGAEIKLTDGTVMEVFSAANAKKALEDGDKITLGLQVADAIVDDNDKAKVNAAMSEGAKAVAAYDYAITVVGENSGILGYITEVPEEMTITLDVSSVAKVADGYTRKWEIIHLHDDEDAVVIEATEDEDGVISFTTKKFSSFTVTYVDTAKATTGEAEAEAEAPNTGAFTGLSSSETNLAIAVTIASVVVLLGAVKLVKSRK